MPDRTSILDPERRILPTPPDSFWKYLAIGALGMIGGMFSGQYTPNRNIVTVDQLQQSTRTTDRKLDQIDTKLGNLEEQLNYLKGEAEAQRRTK